MGWTKFGDLYPIYRKWGCTHGHALVYMSDTPLRCEKLLNGLSAIECMFIYEATENNNKPFDLQYAIEETKVWWGEPYGSDGVSILCSSILGKDGTRTYFKLIITPTYMRDDKLVTLDKLR